jgi:predicted RNase H-like HicB family nuclease
LKSPVFIEKGSRNYSAYVPDFPGCVGTGKTKKELLRTMAEAIEFHIDGMRLDGDPVPEPSSDIEYVEVNAHPAHAQFRPRRKK